MSVHLAVHALKWKFATLNYGCRAMSTFVRVANIVTHVCSIFYGGGKDEDLNNNVFSTLLCFTFLRKSSWHVCVGVTLLQARTFLYCKKQKAEGFCLIANTKKLCERQDVKRLPMIRKTSRYPWSSSAFFINNIFVEIDWIACQSLLVYKKSTYVSASIWGQQSIGENFHQKLSTHGHSQCLNSIWMNARRLKWRIWIVARKVNVIELRRTTWCHRNSIQQLEFDDENRGKIDFQPKKAHSLFLPYYIFSIR